jgi:hypothetical protein
VAAVLTAVGPHLSKAVSKRGSRVNPLTGIWGDVGPLTAYTSPPVAENCSALREENPEM